VATLTTVAVKAADPGRHHDGEGLILFVKPNASRFWVLRVMKDGKRMEMGLGGFPAVSLADARAKAKGLREQVKDGVDVLAAKREAKAKRTESAARTFEGVSRKLHGELSPGFRNPSTLRSGYRRCKRTRSRHSDPSPFRRSRGRWSSTRSIRFGPPPPKRPVGSASVSRPCSTTPMRAAGANAPPI